MTHIADYSTAIKLMPRGLQPGYFNGRGLAKEHVGDFDGALADFGQALEIDPGEAFSKLKIKELKARITNQTNLFSQ
jgi:lipoprotein NlpI